jgi:hypothetical protein
MRRAGKFLYFFGAMLLALVGCTAQHPNLKPPEQPEVLAAPSDDDKRYTGLAQYPPDSLANDPLKKLLQDNTNTFVKSPTMGGMKGSGTGGF